MISRRRRVWEGRNNRCLWQMNGAGQRKHMAYLGMASTNAMGRKGFSMEELKEGLGWASQRECL
jgi:hypothetical protein